MDNCACQVISDVPNVFPHGGRPCGWATAFTGPCPDCHKPSSECSFFSENVAADSCKALTRSTLLALAFHKDGVKRRSAAQTKAKVHALSGGAGAGPVMSTAQLDMLKTSIQRANNLWRPVAIDNPSSTLFLDQSGPQWRFRLDRPGQGQDAEEVTIVSLARRCGLVGDESDGEDAEDDPIRTLAQELKAINLRLAALEENRIQEASAVLPNPQGGVPPPPQNPSQIFNLSGRSFGNVVYQGPPASGDPRPGLGDDAQLLAVLLASGVDPAVAAQALRSRQPERASMDYREQWFGAFEGTSPLSLATGTLPELRRSATPRTFNVQAYDGGTKLTLKVIAWPPAAASDVPAYFWSQLGKEWRRELSQANQRVQQITPLADRAAAPVVPTDVDVFIAQCELHLRTHPAAAVLRAWEAVHVFVVSEYLLRRSSPSWSTAWMLPVFTKEISAAAPAGPAAPPPATGAAGAARSVTQYCRNWNLRERTKCNPKPAADCTKRHKCMVCDGDHPLVDCSRRV